MMNKPKDFGGRPDYEASVVLNGDLAASLRDQLRKQRISPVTNQSSRPENE